jgi:hypothetical protein
MRLSPSLHRVKRYPTKLAWPFWGATYSHICGSTNRSERPDIFEFLVLFFISERRPLEREEILETLGIPIYMGARPAAMSFNHALGANRLRSAQVGRT